MILELPGPMVVAENGKAFELSPYMNETPHFTAVHLG